MKKIQQLLFCLFAFVGIVAFSASAACAQSAASATTPEKNTINWLTIQQAVEATQKNPKKIMVFLETSWCGWCKKMKNTTFTDSLVVDYLNQNFYMVRFDAESKDPVKIGENEFTFVDGGNGRGAHQMAIALLENKMSFPSSVVLNSDLSKTAIIPGYVPAETFQKILVFFGEGFFEKGIKWEDFMTQEVKIKSYIKKT